MLRDNEKELLTDEIILNEATGYRYEKMRCKMLRYYDVLILLTVGVIAFACLIFNKAKAAGLVLLISAAACIVGGDRLFIRHENKAAKAHDG